MKEGQTFEELFERLATSWEQLEKIFCKPVPSDLNAQRTFLGRQQMLMQQSDTLFLRCIGLITQFEHCLCLWNYCPHQREVDLIDRARQLADMASSEERIRFFRIAPIGSFHMSCEDWALWRQWQMSCPAEEVGEAWLQGDSDETSFFDDN